MNAPDATFINGRYELPPHARGVLVLADPPEAGWRMRASSGERSAAECDPPGALGSKRLRQQTCESAGA
jgi:hypothetical protein